MFLQTPQVPIQEIKSDILNIKGVRLSIKREDLIHPEISGNKWRKLKYNIIKAKEDGYESILTFGGAFSNHIAATAKAGKEFKIKTIGIIRGEKENESNPTLSLAKKNGMDLHFVDRTTYRMRNDKDYIKALQHEFPKSWIVPEGGANFYGLNGCIEILSEIDITPYSHIAVACGTGSTLAGISLAAQEQKILGFPALKGNFMQKEIFNQLLDFLQNEEDVKDTLKQIELFESYHFGGYAKINDELIDFKKTFEQQHQVPLDYIYTAKMLYGVNDLLKNGFFNIGDHILAIHTGGLQGNKGIEERYGI